MSMPGKAIRFFAGPCALLLALASPAANAAQENVLGDYEVAEPPRLLRQPIADWTAALLSENGGRIADLYAADGWFKPPCEPVRVGRPAIGESWLGILSFSPASLSLEPIAFDVARSGDMAVERGQAQFLQNIAGLPYGTNVEYVRIWRRTSEGWLITADLYTPGGECDEEEA